MGFDIPIRALAESDCLKALALRFEACRFPCVDWVNARTKLPSGSLGGLARLSENGEQNADENCNDADDNQKLDERERVTMARSWGVHHGTYPPSEWRA